MVEIVVVVVVVAVVGCLHVLHKVYFGIALDALFGCSVESTPKYSARKRHYPRCPRKYKMMGQPVHVDSDLLELSNM